MIQPGQSEILPFLPQKQAEARADQWAETHQAFERPLQVHAGHHRVPHDLEVTRMYMVVGFQSNIRITRRLRCQRPKTVDDTSFIEGMLLAQNCQIQPRFPG
ncbi:hypothetical protein D3C86_1577030 [compost metagenome]